MGSWVFYGGREEDYVFNAGVRFVTYDIGAAIARQTAINVKHRTGVSYLIGVESGKSSYNLVNINNQSIYYLGTLTSRLGTIYDHYMGYVYSFPFGELSSPVSLQFGSATSVSPENLYRGEAFYFKSNIFIVDYYYSGSVAKALRRVTGTTTAYIDLLDNLIGTDNVLLWRANTDNAFAFTSLSYDVPNGNATITYYKSTNGFVWTGPHTKVADLAPGDAVSPMSLYLNEDASRWILANFGSSTASRFLISVDGGANWTVGTLPTGLTALNLNLVTGAWFLGTRAIFAVGNTLYQTVDGSTWTEEFLFDGSGINDIAFDGTSTYMIVGGYGQAVTTTDFSTFTEFTGFDFDYQDIYQVLHTTQTGNLMGFVGGTLSVLEARDVVVIQGGFNSATATIQGTLRLDTSDGVFAARKVYLYNYTTGAKVAETVSDGTTGVWQFTQVASGEYFVVGAAQGDDLAVPRDFDAMGVITVA